MIMSHPGHNNPWRAANDWGYKVKFDTDRQLHQTRQRMAATARECAAADRARPRNRSSHGGSSSRRASPGGRSSTTAAQTVAGIVHLIVFGGLGLLILNHFVPLADIFRVAFRGVLTLGLLVLVYFAARWLIRRRR
jgi:hypothetical protein